MYTHMKKYFEPPRENWESIAQRTVIDTTTLVAKVKNVLDDVKIKGDEAVIQYTKQFDAVDIKDFVVTKEALNAADLSVSPELKQAIESAYNNIHAFHQSQKDKVEIIDTMPGIACWRKSVGIEKVGLYIPGGSAPLFSTVLMLAIPAQIAGCKEVVLCTPPAKDGSVHPAILYCAKLCGVHKVFKIGGVQAIAAMAYGTESVPGVYKIFGPGNQFVTCAKQLVQIEGISIDMPAGPSEVCVLADDSANAAFIASDLLSQAEHGADSQSVLVSMSKKIIEQVEQEINTQLNDLSRKTIAEKALQNSRIIYFENKNTAVDFVNEYAAEHLIISCETADELGEMITNAGSVFLGNYSPESAGDYASGTNHTLPTNGFAKAYSGVSVDSFVKKITFQKLSKKGLSALADTVITMAHAEGLDAHANAVKYRIDE